MAIPGGREAPIGSATMELQMSLKKRQRTLPIAMAGVAGMALIGGAVYAFLSLRTPPADPVQVARTGGSSPAEEGRRRFAAQGHRRLGGARSQGPQLRPAKANQIIAHVFLTQDLRDEARRLTAKAAQVEKDRLRFQEKKEPADWLARANALREQLIQIKALVDPLQDEAARHDDKAGELLKASKARVEKLQKAGDGTAVFRASAVYYASKGHETAERLADFYRKNPDDRKVLHDDTRAFRRSRGGGHARPAENQRRAAGQGCRRSGGRSQEGRQPAARAPIPGQDLPGQSRATAGQGAVRSCSR